MVTSDSSAASGEALTGSEMFNQLFGHLSPHPVFEGVPWLTNYLLLMILAGIFLFFFLRMGHAGRGLEDGQAPKGKVPNLIESLVLFVRDQMVYDMMGKETGRKGSQLLGIDAGVCLTTCEPHPL